MCFSLLALLFGLCLGLRLLAGFFLSLGLSLGIGLISGGLFRRFFPFLVPSWLHPVVFDEDGQFLLEILIVKVFYRIIVYLVAIFGKFPEALMDLREFLNAL